MTDDLEDASQWRGKIEARVRTLEAISDEQATLISTQRGLQVAMGGDVSKVQVEFRAQRGLRQSLHLTQQEHTGAAQGAQRNAQGARSTPVPASRARGESPRARYE